MKIETLAVHAGQRVDPATGAVSAPIHLSTTFERDVEGTYSRGFMYTRNNNPNRQALEEGISVLEGGAGAAAFASGTGATGAIFQALAPGDHVLAHVDAYYGTSRLLREIFLRWGLQADFTDMSDLAAVKKALGPKRSSSGWKRPPIRCSKLSIWPKFQKLCMTPVRSAFATIPGRPFFSDRSISAPILFFIPPQNILGVIATSWVELWSQKATAIFSSAFATFNMKAARSPRPSIVG